MLPRDATRELPHSLDAERAVLAAALLDPQYLEQALETLAPEDFHAEGHRRTYAAMGALHGAGVPVSTLSTTILSGQGFKSSHTLMSTTCARANTKAARCGRR